MRRSPMFEGLVQPTHLLCLAVIGILLFGKRLPEVGRSLGKGIVEFKKGLKGIEDDLEVPNNPAPLDQRPALEPPRPPQRVAATTPKFEEGPTNPPPAV